MRTNGFRELVSGELGGAGPALARAALRALEVPYAAAVRVRNWRYDTSRVRVHKLEVPVVSVGNITLGGTGKTPAVEWLARWFQVRGVRVGMVSRGYGSTSGQPNDEALELAQKLPDVPQSADADRLRAARRAIDEFGCNVLVLDDGFQHRRLARDFDLVLIDALAPFGFGHVFPRGLLREPLSALRRANAVMLSRADLVEDDARREIQGRVLDFAPEALWLEAAYRPQALRSTAGDEQPPLALAGRKVAAFCGIGNPAGFQQSLASVGCEVTASLEFADHMRYTREDIDKIARWADSLDAAAVVCTHKDLVKVGPLWTAARPLLALVGRVEVVAGQRELEAVLDELARRALSCS
jgi:tetraacyldisaccharide 4'-kinase